MAKKAAKKKVAKVKTQAVKKKVTTKKAKPIKKSAKKMKHASTVVVVKYDCGFDNHLAIRGEGAGLSWYKGVALKNVSANEWMFDVIIPEEHLEFKVLINDQVFEIGDNHKVKNGEKIEIMPSFH
jgi:hypothetical protein